MHYIKKTGNLEFRYAKFHTVLAVATFEARFVNR